MVERSEVSETLVKSLGLIEDDLYVKLKVMQLILKLSDNSGTISFSYCNIDYGYEYVFGIHVKHSRSQGENLYSSLGKIDMLGIEQHMLYSVAVSLLYFSALLLMLFSVLNPFTA